MKKAKSAPNSSYSYYIGTNTAVPFYYALVHVNFETLKNSCSLVCKSWHQLLKTESFWKFKTLTEFPSLKRTAGFENLSQNHSSEVHDSVYFRDTEHEHKREYTFNWLKFLNFKHPMADRSIYFRRLASAVRSLEISTFVKELFQGGEEILRKVNVCRKLFEMTEIRRLASHFEDQQPIRTLLDGLQIVCWTTEFDPIYGVKWIFVLCIIGLNGKKKMFGITVDQDESSFSMGDLEETILTCWEAKFEHSGYRYDATSMDCHSFQQYLGFENALPCSFKSIFIYLYKEWFPLWPCDLNNNEEEELLQLEFLLK